MDPLQPTHAGAINLKDPPIASLAMSWWYKGCGMLEKDAIDIFMYSACSGRVVLQVLNDTRTKKPVVFEHCEIFNPTTPNALETMLNCVGVLRLSGVSAFSV